MCQKPMKFSHHQMEMERKAALKSKDQSPNFIGKFIKILGFHTKSKVLVKGGGRND